MAPRPMQEQLMTLGHEWRATVIARYMYPAQYSGLQETVGPTDLAPKLFGTSPGDKQELTIPTRCSCS